jgi:hypothetical protein
LDVIIWSGLGFLVPLILLLCLALCELVFDGIYGKGYYAAHNWAMGLGTLLSAAGCWWLDGLLRRRPDRVLIDKATGQETVMRRNHTFMAIPVRFWPAILTVIGLVLCIMQFVK